WLSAATAHTGGWWPEFFRPVPGPWRARCRPAQTDAALPYSRGRPYTAPTAAPKSAACRRPCDRAGLAETGTTPANAATRNWHDLFSASVVCSGLAGRFVNRPYEIGVGHTGVYRNRQAP